MNVLDSDIKSLMNKYKKYVVYGLSNDEEKASHYVPVYMREHRWDMVGTYPKQHAAGEFKIFNQLSSVPAEYRKMVNVFRSSERVPEVIDEILALGGVDLSAQPLEPWPRFNHSPGMPLSPIKGAPSGSMGRAPFHSCTLTPVLAFCAAPGNQSCSTL